METVKNLIIGSGPAGYTAAIYAGRAGLKPVLYAGIQPGGQLTTTTTIENFPGFADGIDANQLMMDMRRQAERFGTEIRDGIVTAVDFSQRPYIVEDDRTVAVVGGGDTACEEALYLASLAKKVYLIVRKPYLRAAEIMRKRVEEKENIEILYNTNVTGLFGDNNIVEGAHIVKFKGQPEEAFSDIAIDGFFLAIGHKPNTSIFKAAIDTDEQGFIKTKGQSTATNIEGVYAAGDVADPVYRQGVVAAGSGAKAAIEADRFLQSKGEK